MNKDITPQVNLGGTSGEKPIVPLPKKIDEILKKGEFRTPLQTIESHRITINLLFKLYGFQEGEKKKYTANRTYDGIVDLARWNYGDLARECAERFEREIGYDNMR